MLKKLGIVFWLLRYCKWLERNHRSVLLVSLLLATVGGFYSIKLYKNLRTDLEELLPETAQSVKDIKSVMGRVGGLNHLSVIIESDNVEAGRKFQLDLTARLQGLPQTLVARVKDNIIEEKLFFEKNKALYLDLDDWIRIEQYVRDRIRFEKRKKNPFSLGLNDEDVKAPEFDFEALKKKYAERTEGADKFKEGYFESRDGRTHIVLAFLPGKVTDMASNEALSKKAHEIVEELNPRAYAPDLVVGFSGDVQNVVEEHEGLVEDLVLSSVVVTVLVAMAMLLFFRSFWGVYALNAALFAGVLWTFGLSYWVVGYLNANTAFLGSIVVGNGINFGIIMLSRYLEERRRGLDGREALPRAVGFTAQATWTAAIAAGLAYASLVFTDFRGFNQFGIIGGIGMLLCWISSFTTLPALLIWFEEKGWIRPRVGEARPLMARALARVVVAGHKPITIFTVVSIVASIFFLAQLSEDTLESDFTKLRNKRSMEQGSGAWAKKVDAVFERYLTPTIILTRDVKDSAKVQEALAEIVKRDGAGSPISEFKRVEDFLPQDVPRKIRLIERIRELLPPKLVARLSPEDQRMVKELLPDHELKPIQVNELPDGVVAYFREQNGTIGNMVHVYPKLPNKDVSGFWDGKEVIRFAEHLREAIKRAGVPAAIAGQPPLSADMISAIAQDGPKATLFAFLAVVFLVFLLFPRWDLSRGILGSLLLGVLWMGGLMGATGFKINFLNFIALPITFGIGVDYSVNILSRYRLDPRGGVSGAIESTGGAVALCSLTTIIGYSSLLLAGSQAFVSFGQLAVLGEITCLVAAIVSFPAIWQWVEESKEASEFGHHDGPLPTGKG